MTITEPRVNTVLGKRRLRKEDPALLTGEAKFTNDLNIPGALHLAVLRSPYAHARIVAIDTSKAEALKGVLAVVLPDVVSSMMVPPFGHGPLADVGGESLGEGR